MYSHLYFALDCQGTEKVQAIFFKRSTFGELHLNRADFKKMSNLRMLSVDNSVFDGKLNVSVDLPNSLHYLDWAGYPLKSPPSEFHPENLVELHMFRSHVAQLWNEGQVYIHFVALV